MTEYERGFADCRERAAKVCRDGVREQEDNLKLEPSNRTMNGIRIGHARDLGEILSLQPDAHASQPEGVVVPPLAWEGFKSLVLVKCGKPTNRDKTPAELIEMARAMLAAAREG